MNFRQRYCLHHQLPDALFERRVFFDCAPLHLRLVMLVCDNPNLPLFAFDRALIRKVGAAHSMAEVTDAILAAGKNPVNDTWSRKAARLKISAARLQRVARRYFENGARENAA